MTSSSSYLRARIKKAFDQTFGTGPIATAQMLPLMAGLGKLYEAYTLAFVAENLRMREGLTAHLIGGSVIHLKSAGGPINPSYPYVALDKNGVPFAELWTDVFVTTMTYARRGSPTVPAPCDHHEMDIVMVPPGTIGFPSPKQLHLVVECKATDYDKALLREILGVRRELSYLHDELPTAFAVWPRPTVPALPVSCIMVCSTDSKVVQWQPAGDTFGIDFVHLPIR